MAEGFEPYHVPQQSRRDKLRVVNHLQPPPPPACVNSLYDPSSLLSSDLITNLHRHSLTYNLMGFAGGIYADPHLSSLNLNPASDVNSTPDAYPYHPFHGNEPPHTAAAGQSLSLSLSSHQSNLNLPLELNLQRYENSPVFSSDKVNEGYLVSCHEGGGGGGGGAVELSKSTVPLGPFTGYASVLRGSRFLKPAQQLLEELCDAGKGIYADKNGLDSSLLEPPPLETQIVDGGDQTRKKSRLLSMLDEIYKRYKQYCQQMQAAVAAFESVAGFSNAAPFANLALKSMSKHFKCLKNTITQQLQFPSRPRDRDETRLENPGGSSTSYSQTPFHVDQPVWRPQRGLPERAVTVLRAWLFEHFLHPYPTDTDKIMLAKQTGLSRNQVSNWFINARVRLWKPMVEEIHTLETRQGQAEERPPPSSVNDQLPTSCSIECENASTSVHRMGDFTLKRSREDPTEGSAGAMVQIKMPYESLLHNHNHPGVELSNAGGGNGGVSLTLGLHQNGVGLPDSYPMNAARRFGLDSPGDGGYVVSGVAAQDRQFGRGIIDGQIMHDFVG